MSLAPSRRFPTYVRLARIVSAPNHAVLARIAFAPLSALGLLTFACLAVTGPPLARAAEGYYRTPALTGDTVVFTAEGDLWRVPIGGGTASRLTSNPGEESHPAVSPDGSTLAFTAEYEGPREVYTMPLAGGLPARRTWLGRSAEVVGWTPRGEILFATSRYSTLPEVQLVRLDPRTGAQSLVPLNQAADGCYDSLGTTLYFTRLPFQGSHTKRYAGGTAQQIWKYADGPAEAVCLTADYDGTSKDPMWWAGRIYFASDRDGTVNLWSMNPEGKDLRQHTFHQGWDVKSPRLDRGRIVYQLGADLYICDLAAGTDRKCEISLSSDFDQMREIWVHKPLDYLTACHPSPDGDRLVLTCRGIVFVAPAGPGRLVEATRKPGVRFRDARFLPEPGVPGGADASGRQTETKTETKTKTNTNTNTNTNTSVPAPGSVVAFCDETGEVELCRLPANGVGESRILTRDGKTVRFDLSPSPDGERVAYQDKNQDLWIFDLKSGRSTRIDHSDDGPFTGLRWSPDGAWLAGGRPAPDGFTQIMLYNAAEGTALALTGDRFDSQSPAWSPDGKWIYFLSDRHFQVVGGVWGPRQPEPFLDRSTAIYEAALRAGERSRFLPADELHPDPPPDRSHEDGWASGTEAAGGDPSGSPGEKAGKRGGKKEKGKERAPARVVIDREGLGERISEVPLPPGNYEALSCGEDRLFYVSRDRGDEPSRDLRSFKIGHEKDNKPRTVAADIKDYELSQDAEKVMVRKEDDIYLLDASADSSADLSKARVDLSALTFPLDPREERRQMFVEAWRLERDYFYDPAMHGLDWPGILRKYLPLVDRVTDRRELSDLLGEMVGELSALHTFVWGGDARMSPEKIQPASLGAVLFRDEAAGGYRVEHVYKHDPDLPDGASPLRRPGVDVKEGAVIESINGVPLLSLSDPGAALRNQAGQQVLLRVRDAEPPPPANKAARAKETSGTKNTSGAKKASGAERDVIVTPLKNDEDWDLRYHEWEYTRRLLVDSLGRGDIGYVHLRAMSSGDYASWARDFYPIFQRKGLIIDVRGNQGGNIDSWILEKLLRKAWMWWKPRVGTPYWNMQYAFRGHMVVLCNENTISDGEAFTEGFRRLGLGKVIGTRTWGGEIWLSFDTGLVDNGIATAAEAGVYGPEGRWLIEGHGVDPDQVVDNPPHATFEGKDAQLEAAVSYLQDLIRRQPIEAPPAPAYPNKTSVKPR